jgi:hypothetical protein
MINYQGNQYNTDTFIDWPGGTVNIPGSSLWWLNTFTGGPWGVEGGNGNSRIISWIEGGAFANIRLQSNGLSNFNPGSNRTIPEEFSARGYGHYISRPAGTWRTITPLRYHGYGRGADEQGNPWGYTYTLAGGYFIRVA